MATHRLTARAGVFGCLVLTLQTLYPIRVERERIVLDEVELALNAFFVLEYLLRWYSRNFRPLYPLKVCWTTVQTTTLNPES